MNGMYNVLNKKNILLLASCLFAALVSCKRSSDGKDLLGPKVVPAGDGFFVFSNLFTTSPMSANFKTDSVNLSSSFSNEVTWTVNIKGIKSGALKTITNTKNALNEKWNGNSSNIYFFRTGEKAIAELTFMGSSIVLRDTLTIVNPIVYDQKTINNVRYTLIDDFEGTAGVVPMSTVVKDQFDANVVMAADTIKKVQGLNSFLMSGIDLSNNGWCGGINHTNYIEIKQKNKSPLVTDPEELYINIYVYGTGEPNSAIQLEMYEVDDQTNFDNITTNGYTYKPGLNDAWIVQLPITWTGWKCLSKKYSTFTLSKDPLNGGSGNKIKEPNKITGMGVSLLSLPTTAASPSFYIDYIVLSEGGVFAP